MTIILGRHRFDGWKLGEVTFEFLTSTYKVKFEFEANIKAEIKVPSEMLEEAIEADDVFKRRRIKSILKNNLLPNSEPD